MDLVELENFRQIAELGSLSRVAAKLGVAQSTLTRQLKKLEETFGAQLFYRNGRGMALTPAGQKLLAGAREILTDVTRLKSEIAADSLKPQGRVVLGMPPSFCAAIGADLIEAFHSAYPDADLRIHELFSSTLVEWVTSARLDLAVLYEVRSQDNLHVSPLLQEDLFLIQATGRGDGEHSIALADLAPLPLILPSRSNGLRRVIQQAAMEAAVDLNVVSEIDSTTVIKQLVERGYGASILPYGAVWREVGDGRLSARLIAPPAIRALLVLTTPLFQPVSAAARALARLLAAEVSRCVRDGVLRGTPQQKARRDRAPSPRRPPPAPPRSPSAHR